MSDNPRPQLYGARFEALLAERADELPDGVFRIAGKHCESGDVLIDAIALPRPRRGDLFAVPATGAYTLADGVDVQRRPPAGRRARARRRGARRSRSAACGGSPTLRAMTQRLANVPGIVLVSIAAAMWGLDGLIRKPLAHSTSATTIVFGEHVVLVACTLPLLAAALVALWRAGMRYVLAGIFVGAGASAIATILFTEALFHGDFITVVVLQKSQPLIAVVGAWLVLGEQPRPRFAWFLLPALAGIWLIALPHPLAPHVHGLTPIAETLGAAALWGLGTVFGRYLGRKLAFEHVTTVRFAFGLVASACALPIVGASAFSSGARQLLDRRPRPRHRPRRARPLLLRAPAHARAAGGARRARLPGDRDARRSSTSSTARCAGRSGSASSSPSASSASCRPGGATL